MELEQVIGDYGTYIYNFALRLTANPKDAEDLAQETFLKAWLHMDELRDPAALRKWLRTICLNEFLMKIKKDGRLPIDYREDPEALERDGSLLSDPAPSPVDEAIVSEEVARLRDGCFLAMTRKLTLNQRLAFSLIDMFGLSIGETAETLGMTPKAVKGLLYRARMSLESFFKGHCGILEAENPCRCTAWVDFMNHRSKLQAELRKQIDVLDYRNNGYTYDPGTRRKLLHYYRQMPDRRPGDEWFAGVIHLLKNFQK